MSKLILVRSGSTDPYYNLAAEETMTMSAEDGVMTLYLWQNAHTVVIGRNQNPWSECDVEAIKRDQISLARRISGGGAVYHDMGNLNFTFIARDGVFDVGRQTDVILEACRSLGVDARKTGRNDLTVDEKKFSGHAYFSSGGYNYHHGTIMMDVDPDDMTRYLRVKDSKLKSKGVSSVRARVTNLKNHVSSDLKGAETAVLIEAMHDAMVSAAIKEYGDPVRIDMPDIPPELLEKYSSEKWRLGERIPFSKVIEHRFEWGGVEVCLEMKGGIINACRLYSDSLETEIFGALETLITGCRYDRDEILGLARGLPAESSRAALDILELTAASI